jgi:hypothetical protein
MTIALGGLMVSFIAVLCLVLLFRYERRVGKRFAEHLRVRADFIVLKVNHSFHTVFRHVSNDFIRQMFRYLYHTMLRVTLTFVTKLEKKVRESIRVNKTLARHAERESETLSKLEEVALYKAENELSEEEKHAYRKRALEGK